ncbi:unnamed protein product [Didymodactylos carnosus]|uniref:Uncharacterized protein n=1 Tax=Didymodactylos carnosus TaxID=1234261 RepID=A0A815Q2B5_9BILA|nr:unnamed protein product [Didymodactylos carnosus]CAF4327948.1 unnamed protein product [Didymodactylos carnosus]
MLQESNNFQHSTVVFRIKGINFYLSDQTPTTTVISTNSYIDPWSEIDLRNQRILHPLNQKQYSNGHIRFHNYQNSKYLSDFDLENFSSYNRQYSRQQQQQQQNDQLLLHGSINHWSQTFDSSSRYYMVDSNKNDNSFLIGNSIVKSNKEDLLIALDCSKLDNGKFINKYGIEFDEHGPFWPKEFKILHPTPKLVSQSYQNKEYYLMSNLNVKESNVYYKMKTVRIGQSIWSREDFNLTNLIKINTRQNGEDEGENGDILGENNILNDNTIQSSKKLFLNSDARNRIYEERKLLMSDGSIKIDYCFINTGIVVDVHGPFWPMAHPIKHPTPSFNLFSIIENNNNSKRNNNRNKNIKEYYICSSNSSTNQQQQHHQQTYDNQPAMLRYTDTLKHPILIYDMEKSHRNQVAKQNAKI